jgi:clan AA aspartic protease
MGKVMNRIKLINEVDAGNAHRGFFDPGSVRTVEVDALVDTGATMLALPENVVATLGVFTDETRPVRLADGTVREFPVARGIRIEILNRWMTCDALVIPAGSMPLIGQLQLEAMDLLVDAKSREVIVNPASPDAPMMDLLRAS